MNIREAIFALDLEGQHDIVCMRIIRCAKNFANKNWPSLFLKVNAFF